MWRELLAPEMWICPNSVGFVVEVRMRIHKTISTLIAGTMGIFLFAFAALSIHINAHAKAQAKNHASDALCEYL